MIESVTDLTRFESENIGGEWFVHMVPEEDGIHPAVNKPCLLFIRNILSGKTYYYSFSHPDSRPKLDQRQFIQNFIVKNSIRMWALDSKAIRQLLPVNEVRDANLCGFLMKNEILEELDFETPAHNLIRRNASGHLGINKVIPLVKHKEMFDDLADVAIKMIKKCKVDDAYLNFNRHIIYPLSELEAGGIHVDPILFQKYFETIPYSNDFIYSQYNVYTSTGRPSNRFGGINYAALNHTDGSRACFTSRFGKDGRMVVVDYTAFHPRIICNLTNNPIPVDTDIYEYLAKLYFGKRTIDETDIKNAKQLTFRQLYGGIEDKYAHIKYLANLKEFIDSQWEQFEKNGYVLTPIFGRKITSKHILDPNPAKVFNYILQAVEGEVAIPRLQEVMRYLQGKRSKAVLYTYDAVLYDFHKDDGFEILQGIRKIMSNNGQYPMKTYIGESYHDIKLIGI